jgi:hypothetical protein
MITNMNPQKEKEMFLARFPIDEIAEDDIRWGDYRLSQLHEAILAHFIERMKLQEARFLQILEDNRGETLWGEEDSNEVMKESIENFIVAVKSDLSQDNQSGCCELCEWTDYEVDEYDRGMSLTTVCRNKNCPCHSKDTNQR